MCGQISATPQQRAGPPYRAIWSRSYKTRSHVARTTASISNFVPYDFLTTCMVKDVLYLEASVEAFFCGLVLEAFLLFGTVSTDVCLVDHSHGHICTIEYQ